MDYKIFIDLFGKYGYIMIVLIIFLPGIWKLIKEGWELYNSKIRTNLEILDKMNYLFKDALIKEEEKNLEKLIKMKIKDTIFGLLTGVYNSSEEYKNKICILYNKFPQYNIKYLIKISPYIKIENEKIYSNLKVWDKVGYWYFNIINIILILISLLALFLSFVESPKYIITSAVLFLLAFFQYKIIEDIDLAKKFCKKHCNKE
jgi:hypothetical protein